jgi:hypothetical protein
LIKGLSFERTIDPVAIGTAGPLVRSLIGELSLEKAESEINLGSLPDLALPPPPIPSLQRVSHTFIGFCYYSLSLQGFIFINL